MKNSEFKKRFCGVLLLLLVSVSVYAQNTNVKTHPTSTFMKIIQAKNRVTLVNIIKVEPVNYSKLLTLIKDGTESLFSSRKGFIAVAIHSNLEENTIILYGQWNSKLDIENFRKDTEIQTYFKSLLQMAKFESFICDNIPYLNATNSK